MVNSIFKIILPAFLLFCSLSSLAQVTITNKGEKIFILGGTNMYVSGSYVNDSTAASATADPRIVHYGSLFVSGNITNNSPVNILETDSQGIIEFNGSGSQQIDGSSSFSVYRLNINKTGDLQLLKNVEVTNQINFTSGRINLAGHSIDLGRMGSLVNESNLSRISSSGAGTINYIVSGTPTLNDGLNGIGIRMQGDIFDGATIKRGHAVQANAGDGSINRYFDIGLNTGDKIESLRFYYFDAEIPGGFAETDLVVYASYDNGTTWKKLGGAINTTSNFVELTGLNITANVRLSLAEKDCNTPPIVNLGPATKDFCTGDMVTLNAGNPGAYYEWSTSATTQIITTSVSGNYAVTVRDAKGCEGTDNITLTERPLPVANFNAGVACPTQSVNFTNTSTIPSGSLTYSWDFGDPSSTTDNSTTQNPGYTYSLAGDYTVRLAARSSFNCVDTIRKQVTVYPLPQTDFTFSNACFGQTTSFTNTSTIASGGMTYLWNFGDATTSTIPSPTKTFASMTSYSVSLTATSNAGCIVAVSKTVDIRPTPAANFTVSDACELKSVSISNTSSISAGTLTYAWDFGDGTNGAGITPTKSYTNGGSYDISLTASSGFGCTNSIIKPIRIYHNPVAAFSVVDNCQDKSFDFINNSTSSEGTLTYVWNFNDGNISTTVSPSKSFALAGTFNVSLQASTSFGCVNTVSKNVNVFPVPVANFAFNDACLDATIDFTNTSTISSGSMSFEWNFGDVSTSTTTNPSKSYVLAGSYPIQLKAVSNHGCENTKTKQLAVFAMPFIDFGGTINTCGTSYTLDAENPGSSYIWSDGSTNQTLDVTQNGTYSVTVTSSNNCSVFDEVEITLNGVVEPNLDVNQPVCGSVILDAGYPGSTYLWSNGATTRTIEATSSGSYSVSVTDPNGCSGSDQVTLTVNPAPSVNLGEDRTVCTNNPILLDAENPGSIYLWSNNSNNRTLSVTSNGTYFVSVTNGFGCTDMDSVNLIINAKPINNLPPSLIVCDNAVLDAANQGSTYVWSSGSTNQTLNVNSSGFYSVTVTSVENCSATFATSVTVNPSAVVDLGADQSLCFGFSAVLNAGNTGDSYSWSDGSTAKTLIAGESGIYWVDVRRNNGCVKRDSVSVTIYPQIENELKDAYSLCINSTTVLDATSQQGVSYEWFAQNGLGGTGSTFVISEPDKYWVVTRDANNCSVTDTVFVQTDSDPIQARFLAATFVDVGDSVKFVQLSYPDPITFNWNFADGITSTESDPWHMYLMAGDFDASLSVTDPGNCQDIQSKIITVRLLRGDGDTEVEFPFVEILSASIYPNPTPDILNIEFELNKEAEIRIVLYSMNGSVVDSKTAKFKDDTIEFDVRSLRSGSYVLRVFIAGNEQTMRFVKL